MNKCTEGLYPSQSSKQRKKAWLKTICSIHHLQPKTEWPNQRKKNQCETHPQKKDKNPEFMNFLCFSNQQPRMKDFQYHPRHRRKTNPECKNPQKRNHCKERITWSMCHKPKELRVCTWKKKQEVKKNLQIQTNTKTSTCKGTK